MRKKKKVYGEVVMLASLVQRIASSGKVIFPLHHWNKIIVSYGKVTIPRVPALQSVFRVSWTWLIFELNAT
jgi:hypothetical protein